jgi:hypothetical protein
VASAKEAKDPAAEERLNRWATEGPGAARFRWGEPGDFDRCTRFMAEHGVPPNQIPGHCALLHHRATGAWPGHAPAEEALKKAKGK